MYRGLGPLESIGKSQNQPKMANFSLANALSEQSLAKFNSTPNLVDLQYNPAGPGQERHEGRMVMDKDEVVRP